MPVGIWPNVQELTAMSYFCVRMRRNKECEDNGVGVIVEGANLINAVIGLKQVNLPVGSANLPHAN